MPLTTNTKIYLRDQIEKLNAQIKSKQTEKKRVQAQLNQVNRQIASLQSDKSELQNDVDRN